MIAEVPLDGGLVGPTLTCIIGGYFHDLKFGDRFWHESDSQPRPFTVGELNLLFVLHLLLLSLIRNKPK